MGILGLCFKCGNKAEKFYGYNVCNNCKTKLGLLNDETIRRKKSAKFEKEVDKKLNDLEEIYIRRKIKLLHIRDRSKKIK